MFDRRCVELREDVLEADLRVAHVDRTPTRRDEAQRQLEREQHQRSNRTFHRADYPKNERHIASSLSTGHRWRKQ